MSSPHRYLGLASGRLCGALSGVVESVVSSFVVLSGSRSRAANNATVLDPSFSTRTPFEKEEHLVCKADSADMKVAAYKGSLRSTLTLFGDALRQHPDDFRDMLEAVSWNQAEIDAFLAGVR